MMKPTMHLSATFCALTIIFSLSNGASHAATESNIAKRSLDEAAHGNYRIDDNHVIGIDQFIMDNGDEAILFSDYSSGVVRRIFPITGGRFAMGPAFNTREPAELTLTFDKNQRRSTIGVSLRYSNGTEQYARRVTLRREQVSIQGADAKLNGTLVLPSTPGPHPAIILLHGSGPLTRYSFGPYTHFFASLGFAVLTFDKRGTGDSSGTRLDASTGASAPIPVAYYPDHLVDDALAVFQFLQHRPEIDPRRIGLWGSSEGGMRMHHSSRCAGIGTTSWRSIRLLR